MPSREQEFLTAKDYLSSVKNAKGLSLYQHLIQLLTKILNEQPGNVIDIFEDISKELKDGAKVEKALSELYDKRALADDQKALFGNEDDDADAGDDDMRSVLPHIPEIFLLFEQMGVGLGKEEVFRIWLSLKQLIDTKPLQKVRFWGKIYGTERNYYIAETEFKDGEDEEEDEAVEEAEKEEDEDKDEEEEEDVLPKSNWKAPPLVPKEDKSVGANKYTYFVCHEPGRPWTKLPSVTPQQISVARDIKKYFTGNLETPIVSFPLFDGTEANYLRAQIARISAGTQISPLNFYTFDEEEEADEDNDARDNYQANEEFECLPLRKLCESDGSNWVHHVKYILPQGRCTYVNPARPVDEDFEEEEEEDESQADANQPQPEVGPPLLTQISEDAHMFGLPPWSLRKSSNRMQNYAVCSVRSNLWPGAYAYGIDKRFENIYIGFGHKYSADAYTPASTSAICEEYPAGPDITEVDDPTVEEEAEFRAAQAQDAEEEKSVDGDDDD